MRQFIFVTGIVLAVVGLIFPIPGPLDDPVDYAGYFMMIISMVSNTLKK